MISSQRHIKNPSILSRARVSPFHAKVTDFPTGRYTSLRKGKEAWKREHFLVAGSLAVLVGCSSQGSTAVTQTEGGPTGSARTTPNFDAAGVSSALGPSSHDAAGPEAADRFVTAAPAIDAGFIAPAAYLTTDDLSAALAATPVAFGDQSSAATLVTLDPSTTYQAIVGFGASITDSSSYVMTKYLAPMALTLLLQKLFDFSAGIGLNFLRQPMGASDFSSVGNFSYDDGNDPALANFSIAQDLKATVPMLQQALAINPDVYIVGTPWSPPAWMKLNGSMNGAGGSGNSGLVGADYGPLAEYFVKFVQAYAHAGVPIAAVTPQNEPLNGSSLYPGMSLTAPYEAQLVGGNLGPAFSAAQLSTLVWAYDHNWDHETYVTDVIGDLAAGPVIEGAAFHCYGGDPSAMATFHRKFPSKSVYMTECSGGAWQTDPFANTIDLAINSTTNWARVVALWNVALDEKAGPQNHGCSDCRGVVTVNSQSGEVTYNADYYALGHFSKFVRRGARRIASMSSSASLNQVAFLNPDGSIAVVAHNTGAVVTMRVRTDSTVANVQVPANGAVTLILPP